MRRYFPLEASEAMRWVLFCLIGSISGFPMLPLALRFRHQNPTETCIFHAASSDSARPTYGLYEVQEELLVKRGAIEEDLMQENCQPLKANQPRGVAANKGFGGATSGGKNKYISEAKAHAKVIRKEGVVRIDNVLSEDLADQMREFVFTLRKESLDEVEAGTKKSSDRFADVLLKSNRCDLKIPLGEKGTLKTPAIKALHHALCKSPIKDTIAEILGEDAVLYELSCLISDPGSQRQVIHPDNPMVEGRNEPSLLTCFMALQDVQMDMGPTVYLPQTHTIEAHADFQDETIADGETESPKDRLLRTRKKVLGVLPKGCCSMYDSRLLHCGSANKGTESRAIFYFSFRNPTVTYPGNPASIRSDLGSARITLKDLTEAVKNTVEKGATNPFNYD